MSENEEFFKAEADEVVLNIKTWGTPVLKGARSLTPLGLIVMRNELFIIEERVKPDNSIECFIIPKPELFNKAAWDWVKTYNVKVNLKDPVILDHLCGLERHSEAPDKTLKMLIDKGLDINMKDSDGSTPLIEASKHKMLKMVKALIKNKADLEAKGAGGMTALMWVSRYGYVEVAKMLLKAGASLEIARESGHTALMDAARWDNLTLVKLFLAKGAKADIKNKDGHTAYDLVVFYNHSEHREKILKILKEV